MKKHLQILTLVYVLLLVPFKPLAATASWAAPEAIADSAANNDACDLSNPAYEVLAERVRANQMNFYIYQDADSGFNHGFPSGFFGVTHKTHLDSACIDDLGSPTGCSEDQNVLDCERGNVLRISFDSLSEGEFAGVNIEEPEKWGINHKGEGYDITGSTHIQFDVRSPDGIKVRFGVGGCTTEDFFEIPPSWTSMSIPLDSFDACEPDITDLHILFTVVTNHENAPNGGIVLLDNIRFEPVPTSQESALGLPCSTKTCGVIPLQNPDPGRVPIPPDQVNRNVATIYEASLTLMALLDRGTTKDLENARLIAHTIHYALHHENSGDPLPEAPDGSIGLHNAYECGDIALYNDQAPLGDGKRSEVRLSGFSAELCDPSGFCLVLDGATGGNDAFAILALAAAYKQFKDPHYLEDALTIGNWIHGNLKDTTYTGYGGYYLGYPDEGEVPKYRQEAKSVENNADIFAAFMVLADLERQRGHHDEANQWTLRAYVAGDFVRSMYDEDEGRFHAGTVPDGTPPEWGIDPSGPQRGNNVINVFDFLDSNTFITLALATFPRYRDQIDWRRPIQYVLDVFAQSITAGSQAYHGFNIVKDTEGHGPNGIAWEFTAQAVVAMRLVDRLYGDTRFEEMADFYLDQICQAQIMAPFGDQRGLVASTLQDGDSLPPHEQCLSTPFQCIPERIGLAATTWAIFAEKNINPFPTISAAKLYVYWRGIDDDKDCKDPAHPCKTIGHALDQAAERDIILVAEGTYTENLAITKTVTLKGAYEPINWSRSLRRYTTMIDGNLSGPVINVKPNLSGTTVIDGFTITNGNAGISTLLSILAVRNSQIVHNHNIEWEGGSGGGMKIDHSFVSITNTIVADNEAEQYDGGIRIISTIAIQEPYSEVNINNSTIAYNHAKMGRNGIMCSLSYCIVINSIVWGHGGEDFYGLGYHTTYSDIQMCLLEEGNICEDPRFVDPDNGDYHLRPDSPCIDKGTNNAPELPLTDFEGDPRIIDGDDDGTATVDMGADEYGSFAVSLISGLGSYPSNGGWIEEFSGDYSHEDWLRIRWRAYNLANGEARLAAGNIDGDGSDEVVVGLGPVDGNVSIPGGWFEVLDDDGTHLAWGRIRWPAYNRSNGETWPACGDVDGDGSDEIIVGLGSGGAGWLEIFDYSSGALTHKTWLRINWNRYNTSNGETRPASGDVDGDGKDEIIAGLGSGGGGWFKVFDDDAAGYSHLAWGRIRWPYYNITNGETRPACGDVEGDGSDEIIAGLGSGSGGWFEIFDYAAGNTTHKAWVQVNWNGYSGYNSANGETRPACGDIDGDGRDEIVVGLGPVPNDPSIPGGYMEVFDDDSTGYSHLAWPRVHWPKYCRENGETRPAVKK